MSDMTKKLLPTPKLTVVAQALVPREAALTWLAQAQNDSTEFRVPVELAVSVMGVSGGKLGFGNDRIAVKLNDSALGSGLKDRARSWFGPAATTCGAWVWARWNDGTLVVTKAEGPIKPDEYDMATHIHVAK